MEDKLGSLLKSRRFWVAAAGLTAVVAAEAFGIELDTEQLVSIATIVVGWILGDSLRKTA